MTYGPFHTVRCKDDIAAALLDHDDADHSATRETDSAAKSVSTSDSEGPTFLSDDETEADVLTGPARSTDE